jgi:hypothetical protein
MIFLRTNRSSSAPASCARAAIPVNAKQKTTAANINFFTNIVSPWLMRRCAAVVVLVRRENGEQLLQANGGKVTIG